MAGLKDAIRERARDIGFDAVGFAAAALPDATTAQLQAFVADGRHGEMGWMAETLARRGQPQALWAEAKSVIVLGVNHGPRGAAAAEAGRGAVARYAQGGDYHDPVKKMLKRLARWLAEAQSCQVKVFVDTAPVMEKPLAQLAGIGWQGKHTNLVSRQFGSWLLLGEVFTDLAIAPDQPETDHCGSCTACIEACPTEALTAPYRIDARRCISYLTIEHKGMIEAPLMEQMGAHVFGCDDCLAACPWTKFDGPAALVPLIGRPELAAPRLAELAGLDDAGFRQLFRGSPIKRGGRARLLRNVLIAIANAGDPAMAAAIRPLCHDPSPLVAGTARWALAKLPATG